MAGRSCGGGASSMGTSFGWDAPAAPSNSITGGGRGMRTATSSGSSAYGDHSVPNASGSSLADLAPGAIVAYAMKPGVNEEEAVVIDIGSDGLSAQGRRDNIVIRFQDGRERNTTEGKLRVLRAAPMSSSVPLQDNRHQNMGTPSASPSKLHVDPNQYQPNRSPAESQNIPPSPERHSGGFGDTGRSSIRIHSTPGGAGAPPPTERYSTGFGDTGRSSIRIDSNGGGNSMGSSFGWGTEQETVNQRQRTPPQHQQQQQQQYHDQHQHQYPGQHQNQQQQQQYQQQSQQYEYSAPSPYGGNQSLYGEQVGESPRSKKGEFQENRIGSQVPLQVVQGSSTGELAIGQAVMYKQTSNSDPVVCTIVDLELPSTNGAMRTKTYYTVEFEDGRSRQTTREKLTVIN